MNDSHITPQNANDTTTKGLNVALEFLRTDTLDLTKRLEDLKARANKAVYNATEAHLAEMVKRLEERGIGMGPKDQEFADFDLSICDSHPSKYINLYLMDNEFLQLYLASFGAPWTGCIKLQEKKSPVFREDVWVKQGKAMDHIDYWRCENVGTDIAQGIGLISAMNASIFTSFTQATILEHCSWCNAVVATSSSWRTGLKQVEIAHLENQIQQAKQSHTNLNASMNA